MKKSVRLLSLLLAVALYGGCDRKDDPASNNRVTANASASPSGTPTPAPTTPAVNHNAGNANVGGHGGPKPVPPIPPTPPPPRTPTPETPRGPWVMCSCYDADGKTLLWKKRLRKSECERLCPLPLDRPGAP